MTSQKPITRLYTFYTYGWNMVWICLAGCLMAIQVFRGAELTNGEIFMLVALIAVIPFAWATYKIHENKRRLQNHDARVKEFVAKNGLQINVTPGAAIEYFKKMALQELRGAREKDYQNLIAGPDWQYCDFSYKIYQRDKYGDHHSSTAYYSVITTKLPRELPNVFFDSLRARRRQFRFHFAREQRHSLEGDFDTYFVTYFPPDYTIDSMSFISPDVMLALRAAADYDIEIVGDRLYMYGPLAEPSQQIPDMLAKLQAIKKELLDNILTYRDERLPYNIGRQKVAIAGAKLERSKFWTYVGIAFFVVYVLLRIAAEIWGH